MKIKLNVTKDLKRELKLKAEKKDLERNAFIYEIIEAYIKENEDLWLSEVDQLIEIANADETSVEDKAKKQMKKTTKKQQPIILKVEERTYYAIGIIAKEKNLSREELLIDLLKK